MARCQSSRLLAPLLTTTRKASRVSTTLPSVHVKYALTPQRGGFLASGFSHTLNPYKGCAFGRTGCPFCYVRESPMGKFGSSPWGTWVVPKANLVEVLAAELRKPQARQYRIFMASATDPYQAVEARTRLSRRCLELFHAYPIARLVVQTRSLLVRRDFDVLARLPFATLNVSIETDLPHIYRRFTRSSASPARRLQLVREALSRGIATQITVAPMLPVSSDFAASLGQAVGAYGRIIVDTFVDGDGADGKRSARLGMDRWLTETGYPGWFEQCRTHAQDLMAHLQALLGPERVLWSAAGFCDATPITRRE